MLRDFGSSGALKTSYFWLLFVPLAARALVNVKERLELTIFGDVFHLTFGLPFSWQLFYYSAVAFSIAGILYSWRCPPIVKRYTTFPAFFDDGRGVPYLRAAAGVSGVNQSGFDNLLSVYESSPDQYRRERLGELFWFVYNRVNFIDPLGLSVCVVFYGIGLVLLGIVFAQNFLFVFRMTFPQFF